MTSEKRSEEPDMGPTLFLFADPEPAARRSRWRRLMNRAKDKLSCKKDDPEMRRKALVSKGGNYRLDVTGLSEHKRRFLADLYITLIDLPWRYAVAILFNVFLISFVLFGVLWWLMGTTNGDFDNFGNPNHTACLLGVQGFAGSLLFSIETQTTIGYGFAYPNPDCGGTLPLIYLQVVIGFLLETLMLGFIFVKVARPKYRAQTLLFSRHAVVCFENGVPCLQVRVGDLRKSHLLDASITGMVVRKHSTPEGAYYPLYQSELEFEANGMGDKLVLMWPIILTHRITEESPLYDMRPADLSPEKFEIILFLTGTVEATGEVCQARTSYVPREILWGHRFERIEEYDISHGRWHVDFTSFDDVIYCQNLRHSARELAVLKDSPSEGGASATPAAAVFRGDAKKDEGKVKGATGGKVKKDEVKGATGGKGKVKDDKAFTESEYYKRALRLFRDTK